MQPAVPFETDAFFHIYTRGNNREDLFKEERNYAYFLQLWARHMRPFVDTYAYALLPNHFHFIVRVARVVQPDGRPKHISRAMANCFSGYALAINQGYGRTGSLFAEHPSRKRIDTDAYLHNAICYADTNAQKHGLVSDFRMYPHTSYASLLSDKPTALLRDWVLDFFGGRDAFIAWHARYAELGYPRQGLMADGDDE